MYKVKRFYYANGSFHEEVIYVPTGGKWTTEEPSKKKDYIRRTTLDEHNIIDVSEYFPEDKLPIQFEWGYSQGPIPADVRRNKRCSVYGICTRCKTNSSYYRIAKFIAVHPNGVQHEDIAQFMGHKIRQNKYRFYNSTTLITILRFVGAITFDKKLRLWFPGPNSSRFLEVIEKRSICCDRRNYGDKA